MVAEINLLPKRERKTKGDNIYLIILLGIFLLVGSFIVYSYFSGKKDLSAAEALKLEIEVELGDLGMRLDEVALQQTTSREAAVELVEFVSYDVTPIIQDVHTRVPAHAYLRNFAFSENQVSLHADFEDKTQIAMFLSSLQSSDVFTDATLNQISTFYPYTDGEAEESSQFEELPRYSVEFTLAIDLAQVRAMEVGK